MFNGFKKLGNSNAVIGWLSGKCEVLLAAICIICIGLSLTPPHLEAPYKASGIPDFTGYYSAAKIFSGGNPDKIYDTSLQQKTLVDIAGTSNVKPLPYLYPPHNLLFFIPLANFSLKDAFFIWQMVNIAGTIAILSLLFFSYADSKKTCSLLISAILIVTCYPWLLSMEHGQTIILITVGIWGYQLLAKHKQTALAGLLVILISFKPQLIIAPVFYLLIIYGKPLWLSTISATLALIVICSYLFGFSIWPSYISIMLTASNEVNGLGANLPVMANARALFLLFAGEKNISIINTISSILWAGSIIASICIAFAMRLKTQELQDLGFSLVIVISCLFSPWLHVHSFVLLVIPVAYLVKYNNFQPHYIFWGVLINFNLLAMFVDSLGARFNPALWVSFQIILISFISYNLLHKNKEACALPVVN